MDKKFDIIWKKDNSHITNEDRKNRIKQLKDMLDSHEKALEIQKNSFNISFPELDINDDRSIEFRDKSLIPEYNSLKKDYIETQDEISRLKGDIHVLERGIEN